MPKQEHYEIYSLPVMLAVFVGIPLAILVAGISLHWLGLTFRDGAK